MDNQVREITWSAHELQLKPEDVLEVEESLATASEDGQNSPTLAEVRQRTGHRRRRIGWTLFFVLLALVIFAIGLAWLFGFISTHKWWLLKQSVKLVHNQVSAAVSRFAHDRFDRVTRSSASPPSTDDSGYDPQAPDGPTYSSTAPPPPPARHHSTRRRRRFVSALFSRRRTTVPTHRELSQALQVIRRSAPLEPIS